MTFKQAWNRRSFLSMLGAAGVGLAGADKLHATPFAARGLSRKGYDAWPDGDYNQKIVVTGFGSTGNPVAELGLKPIINANCTCTTVGGSLIPPEVEAVERMGSNHFVSIDDLERAAGKKMAEWLKLPAGYSGLITAGAAAAILVGWAGVLTGDNKQWIEQIPDLTGIPKYEVLIQKSHRYAFDHQIRQTGIKLVEVETRQDVLNAIGPHTLGMHFLNKRNPVGKIQYKEWLQLGKDHGLYNMNDAAADTPPISRLWEYVNMGFDMVTFSGGKDIRGPQCAGILLAKDQICANGLINMSPQEDTIARPCKVGKEEIFGMLKALDLFLHSDQEALTRSYYARLGVIAAAARKFPSVKAEIRHPEGSQASSGTIQNVTPLLVVSWDQARLKIDPKTVYQQLEATEPASIVAASVANHGNPDEPNGPVHPYPETAVGFNCWQLKPGEEKIIANRLAEIFHAVSA